MFRELLYALSKRSSYVDTLLFSKSRIAVFVNFHFFERFNVREHPDQREII